MPLLLFINSNVILVRHWFGWSGLRLRHELAISLEAVESQFGDPKLTQKSLCGFLGRACISTETSGWKGSSQGWEREQCMKNVSWIKGMTKASMINTKLQLRLSLDNKNSDAGRFCSGLSSLGPVVDSNVHRYLDSWNQGLTHHETFTISFKPPTSKYILPIALSPVQLPMTQCVVDQRSAYQGSCTVSVHNLTMMISPCTHFELLVFELLVIQLSIVALVVEGQ